MNFAFYFLFALHKIKIGLALGKPEGGYLPVCQASLYPSLRNSERTSAGVGLPRNP